MADNGMDVHRQPEFDIVLRAAALSALVLRCEPVMPLELNRRCSSTSSPN
jgi:hypothetical protein